MQLSAYFSFASAAVAIILALAGPIAKPSNKQRWVFALGMLALAAEALFTGLGFRAENVKDVGHYQQLRLVATSFVPGFWLLFVAIYTRGGVRSALSKRALILVPTLTVPPAIALYFQDSLVLLEQVVALVAERGWQVINVDSVVIAERPKLKPHIAAMRAAIAARMGLEPDQVGVKATTNEKLGPEGREEGISCQAVALLQKP